MYSALGRRIHGMKKAFIELIDNDGILLRPNHYPILGAEAIDYLSQSNDSSFSLSWLPSGGEVASSGDPLVLRMEFINRPLKRSYDTPAPMLAFGKNKKMGNGNLFLIPVMKG